MHLTKVNIVNSLIWTARDLSRDPYLRSLVMYGCFSLFSSPVFWLGLLLCALVRFPSIMPPPKKKRPGRLKLTVQACCALAIKRRLSKSAIFRTADTPPEVPDDSRAVPSTFQDKTFLFHPPFPSTSGALPDPEAMSLVNITREILRSNRDMANRLNILKRIAAIRVQPVAVLVVSLPPSVIVLPPQDNIPLLRVHTFPAEPFISPPPVTGFPCVLLSTTGPTTPSSRACCTTASSTAARSSACSSRSTAAATGCKSNSCFSGSKSGVGWLYSVQDAKRYFMATQYIYS